MAPARGGSVERSAWQTRANVSAGLDGWLSKHGSKVFSAPAETAEWPHPQAAMPPRAATTDRKHIEYAIRLFEERLADAGRGAGFTYVPVTAEAENPKATNPPRPAENDKSTTSLAHVTKELGWLAKNTHEFLPLGASITTSGDVDDYEHLIERAAVQSVGMKLVAQFLFMATILRSVDNLDKLLTLPTFVAVGSFVAPLNIFQ